MKVLLHIIIVANLFFIIGCTATEQPENSVTQKTPASVITQTDSNPQPINTKDVELTLEQIMSDVDWLGRQPLNPNFAPHSNTIVYERKREDSVLTDHYMTSAQVGDNGNRVALQDLHELTYSEYIDDAEHDFVAWIFEGNIFSKNRDTDVIKQLTKDAKNYSRLAYLSNGSLSVQSGNSFFAVNVDSGLLTQVLTIEFSEAPQAVIEPKDFLAKEQLALIEYENVQRKNRRDREQAERALIDENPSMVTQKVYLDPQHRLVQASISPNGQWAILATTPNQPTRSESDIMPDYIDESGRIVIKQVRQRVADAKPISHQLHLVNIVSGKVREISYKALPGYNDDVLADVKQENAEAIGESYTVNRLPRDIRLRSDRGSSQSPIQWHKSSQQAAIMLEAWDNKDRWLVTLDPKVNKLVTQHKLHDDAWINHSFNQFGWFENALSLYYLSEESGYSQLYIKPINGEAKSITSGEYVVSDVYLSQSNDFFVYKANKKHPGIYEIYHHNVITGDTEALTNLNGMTDYKISPQEDTLVLTHSKLSMPPELYTYSMNTKTATKLTSTVSDAFLSIDWVVPSVVAIESSHVEQPIYSRVYLPENVNTEKRRAVVFNHGAGYLQNAHLGWSLYFREFMFHSLLAKQGYVVLDMDYRASAGYGRDWRTAIYRHMGKPEIEDNVDGVNWLVENANVDRNRVGTYGGSYGGFLTFMALFTEPDLYQAGAALRPVSDWAHYNHGYTSNILNTPDVDPIAYRRSSPIYFAEGLEESLLINAPMVDDNVFFVDVVRLVQRLIELEKQDFETAIYPVEPHGFVQPSSWLDEYRRIYKLFEENL